MNFSQKVADALKRIGCFSIQKKILAILLAYASCGTRSGEHNKFVLLFKKIVSDTQPLHDTLKSIDIKIENTISDAIIRQLLNIINDSPNRTVWSKEILFLYFDGALIETLPV